MLTRVVLLSGQVSSGKTTLCKNLEDRFGFCALKTKEVISQLADGIEQERGAMQNFGEKLDRTTKGAWVCEALARLIATREGNVSAVVDAVRIEPQINAIRRAYGSRVVHIHLAAPPKVLAVRYKRRHARGFREFRTYAQVLKNKTESEISTLASIADVVIDTQRCTKEDVVIRAAAHLGLYDREYLPLADVLIGGQYGSEGKGHISSYLAPEYDFLVRVGGPNAGHKVAADAGIYTFRQLPSGTLFSQARLIIGPGAVISVERLIEEIAFCQVDADRLSIDPQAMIIEKEDARNERTLVRNISSTGQGVGYATARRILDRADSTRMARDIKELHPFVRETYPLLERAFASGKKVFLEGTQGTGLSLYHGHYPHVTSRDTTVAGCLAEAGIPPRRVRKTVMVCRTYPIRVANPLGKGKTSGFMSQPLDWDEISGRCRIPAERLRESERTSTTNKRRRVSEFDWQLLRKAATLNGPTDIALTFADYLSPKNSKARRFEQLDDETIRFIQEIERVTSAPVSLISTGFHSRSIIDRRSW